MSEQGNEFDVEGHRIKADGPEDTEGHRIKGSNLIDDEDDVEGHRYSVQPPKDTDLGNSPR